MQASYAPLKLSWTPDRIEGRPCCLLPGWGENGKPAPRLPDLQGMGVPARGIPIEFRPISRNGWSLAMDKGHLSLVERSGAINREQCQRWLDTFSEKMVGKLTDILRDNLDLPFTIDVKRLESVRNSRGADTLPGTPDAVPDMGMGTEEFSMTDSIPVSLQDDSVILHGDITGDRLRDRKGTAVSQEEGAEKICSPSSCSELMKITTNRREVSDLNRRESVPAWKGKGRQSGTEGPAQRQLSLF